MNTRVGKIARLPKPIREQLNQRLENGERGKTIVQWLNQLPEVQKIITEQFNGHAIREQNLSEWRNGGYLDWLHHQEFRQQILTSVEHSEDYSEDEGKTHLSERLAYLMTAQLMTQLWSLNQLTDPAERWEKTREVARELSRIRRDDQRFLRTDLRRRKFEADYPIVVTNEKGEPAETKQPAPPTDPKSETPSPTTVQTPTLPVNLVAADVSPLHLNLPKSEPTHVGCYGSEETMREVIGGILAPNQQPNHPPATNPEPAPIPKFETTNPVVFPHLSGVIRPDTGLKIRTVGDEVTSLQSNPLKP